MTLAIAGGAPAVPPDAHRRWPEITAADRAAVTRVLDRGELWGPFGPETVKLEREFASFVGTRHCLLVNSGTAALHCALVAAGVGRGDEVIVPAFTFVATAMSVLHAGATPVFSDVRPSTHTIDPAQVEALIGPRTRAIVPVHVHGLPADMCELTALAQRHGLRVIEDACQAHGATYRGIQAGALAYAGAFSLNGSKHVPAGEGGLFVTDDDDAIAAARRLAIFGEQVARCERPGETRSYRSYSTGWNYRAHEMTAAVARARLARLPHFVEKAQENAAILTRGLAELPGFEPPHVPADRSCVFYRYRINLQAPDRRPPREWRDRILHSLRAENVAGETWQLQPVPAQPLFGRPASAYPETASLLDGSIVLGSATQPIFNQPRKLIERYVDAFVKLAENTDVVARADYVPVTPVPCR